MITFSILKTKNYSFTLLFVVINSLLLSLIGSDYNTSEQKQACKKHELYVSFRDLGWQVRQNMYNINKSQQNNEQCLLNKIIRCPKYRKLFLQGLDHCTWGVCCFLLWWRMLFSTQRTHECNKSCHCANAGKYSTECIAYM